MTLFEYVMVAVSIVLSFGVVRLLDGLRPAVQSGRRYWIHLLWIPTKLLNHAFYWWGLWSLREIASWNLASFLWFLVFPGTLYLQSTALVTTNPTEVTSWREHFYEIRTWFFWINVLLLVHTLISSWVFLGLPLLDPTRLPFALLLVLNVLGATSANQRLHGTISILALLTQFLGFGVILFRPGALSPA